MLRRVLCWQLSSALYVRSLVQFKRVRLFLQDVEIAVAFISWPRSSVVWTGPSACRPCHCCCTAVTVQLLVLPIVCLRLVTFSLHRFVGRFCFGFAVGC